MNNNKKKLIAFIEYLAYSLLRLLLCKNANKIILSPIKILNNRETD